MSALGRVLYVQHALGERGWFAVLSTWHAAAMAIGETVKPGAPIPGIGPPAPDEGRSATEAWLRWRRLAASLGVAHDDPQQAVEALERLGLLRQGRALGVLRRWQVVDPVPDARTHPALDDEGRRAAVAAADRFAASMRIGGLLEDGDGSHEAASVEALAADAGTDVATLRTLEADGDAGWRIVELADGRARLEQLPDDERDRLLAEIDADEELA